jgi:hypothetical protein
VESPWVDFWAFADGLAVQLPPDADVLERWVIGEGGDVDLLPGTGQAFGGGADFRPNVAAPVSPL